MHIKYKTNMSKNAYREIYSLDGTSKWDGLRPSPLYYGPTACLNY